MRFKDGVLYNNVRFTDRDIDLAWNAEGSRHAMQSIQFRFLQHNSISLRFRHYPIRPMF